MEEKEILEKEEKTKEELSEYEQKIIDYEYRLEEALVNIDVKENIALSNEESIEAIEEYKKAKADYEALRKEYKQYKKENAPKTWWNTLPLRMKVFTFFNLIITFPYISWNYLYVWYLPYLAFYGIFSTGLNKLFENGRETLVYIYLGIMWYLISVVLSIFLVILFVKRKKDDIHPEYKKTYLGFIIGNAILLLGLIAFEIVKMITLWA